jgi:hypothetical protein
VDFEEFEAARDTFVRIGHGILRSETPYTMEQRIATIGLGDPISRARAMISGEQGYSFDERRALTKRLVYEVVLDGLDERILRLFESVRSFMPNYVPIRPLTEESVWLSTLTLIVQYQIGEGDERQLEERHFRDAPIARAVARLRYRNFKIEIKQDGFSVEEAEAGRLWRYIAGQTSQRPSRTSLLNAIFEHLASFWRSGIGRYVVPRLLGTAPIKNEPSIPWNYLLQLASRAYANNIVVPLTGAVLADNEFVSLITDVVAVFDWEPYSIHELTFPSVDRYLELLTGLAQFQASIDLAQRSSADLVPLLRSLFCWIPGPTDETRLPFSIEQLIAFAEAFLAATENRHGPLMLDRAEVEAHLNIPIFPKELAALWSAMTHENGSVNVVFASPLDWRFATLATKPFIPQQTEHVAIVDRAVATESFLIAALKAVNHAIPGANTLIGRVGFESYVRDLLSAGGHRVLAGTYGTSRRGAEIDALVETEEAIILIECKKRMLGTEALTGDRSAVVRELVTTVAKAHEQLLRAERHLLENGSITVNGVSVELGDKEIFRVAVSLHDWGVLHDQSTLRYMLTSLLQLRFGHHRIEETGVKEWIDEVNDIAERLVDHVTAIVPLKPGRDRQPFWNSLFLPVGVLHLMLDRKGDVGQLVRRLGTRSRLITGNLDAYADFEQLGNV